MNDLIQINLLGEFALFNAKGFSLKFHSKLERHLVAYLGFYAQTHDRDALVDVFWATERTGTGRKNLSQLMWRVAQSVGQDVFLADRDSLQLETNKTLVDLNLLRQQLNRVHEHDTQVVRNVIEASQKELLKGFNDDWVFEARDQWQVELIAALRKLEHLAENAGDLEDVIRLAKAQIRLEPLGERANATVIRTCLVLGRSSEARDHFEFFRRALADIGELVSGKMRVLAERIQSGQSRSNIHNPSAELGLGLPMVGRSQIREACLKVMAQAKSGQGRIVLIEGEPGIGKTRLIQSLIDDATWRGQNVLRATAQELAQLEPYRIVQEMLSDNLGSFRLEVLKSQLDPVWLLEAARVVPKLATGKTIHSSLSDLHDHQRLQASLLEVFKTLCRIQPLAVFIDDLQWADENSLELLKNLARILEKLPILVVIGTRIVASQDDNRVWRCLEALDHYALTLRLQLEPLKRDKIKDIAQKALGIQLLPEIVAHLEQVSQGNPLFVIETLKVMLETGIALQAQELWLKGLQTMPLPGGLRELIGSRLLRLTPPCRELLQVAATIGTRFEFELLQQIMPLPTLELLDLLDNLLQSGFLVEIEPGFGFSHDQMRQTVYQQLSKSDAVALHGRVLNALQNHSPDAPEVLALHAEQAGQIEQAKRYRLLAAEKSIGLHSYQQALTDLEAIGQLTDTDFESAERIRFLEARIRADGANNHFERMLQDMTGLESLLEHLPSERLEVLCRRAKTLATIGRTPEALALIDRAQLENLHNDPYDQVQVLIAKGGVILAGGGSFDLALEPLIHAVQLCSDNHHNLKTEAHSLLGRTYSQLARFDEALEEFQKALHLAKQDGDLYREAVTLGRIARCYCSQGYDRQAIPSLERAITLTRTLGLRFEEVKNLTSLGLIEYKIGNILEGITIYDQALALSRTIGAKSYEALILGSTAFLKYLHCDAEKARLELHLALEIHQELSDREGQGYILSQLGVLHHWGGQLKYANHFLEQAVALLAQIKDLVGEINASMWLIENMIFEGRFSEARDLANYGMVGSKSHHLPNQEFQFKRLIANIDYLNAQPQAALQMLQDCLPNSGENQGVEIDGFYRFHLLHYKILNALDQPAHALEALQKANHFAQIELQSYPPSQRPGWRKAVPVVNEILSLFEQHFEQIISVSLASKDAPNGRGLLEHEYLEIQWLVRSAADDHILDKTKRRQHQLERLCTQALEQGALPTVEDLAQALNASVATIKRDLAALRVEGIFLSTRGTRASSKATDAIPSS